MKIGIICNLNLARSPLITSFLRKNFSHHEFFSAGISISSGMDYPANVNYLAKAWDLPLLDSPNSDLTQRSIQVDECDLLVCADDYVYEFCKVNLIGKKLINLAQVASHHNVNISDPINLEFTDFQVVIAKYFYIVYEFMSKIENHSRLISMIKPKDSNLISNSIDECRDMARSFSRPLIIDYNLRVPNVRFLAHENFAIETVENLIDSKYEVSHSVIHTLNREMINPELRYLDKVWREGIRSLAKSFDLILMLPPLAVNGVEIHDSYLASLTL